MVSLASTRNTPRIEAFRDFAGNGRRWVCALPASTKMREETHFLKPVKSLSRHNRSIRMYGKYTEPPEERRMYYTLGSIQ